MDVHGPNERLDPPFHDQGFIVMINVTFINALADIWHKCVALLVTYLNQMKVVPVFLVIGMDI